MVAAAWLAVATVVGVLVGRIIRERDRQVPPPPNPPRVDDTGKGTSMHRVHGWGRRRS